MLCKTFSPETLKYHLMCSVISILRLVRFYTYPSGAQSPVPFPLVRSIKEFPCGTAG